MKRALFLLLLSSASLLAAGPSELRQTQNRKLRAELGLEIYCPDGAEDCFRTADSLERHIRFQHSMHGCCNFIPTGFVFRVVFLPAAIRKVVHLGQAVVVKKYDCSDEQVRNIAFYEIAQWEKSLTSGELLATQFGGNRPEFEAHLEELRQHSRISLLETLESIPQFRCPVAIRKALRAQKESEAPPGEELPNFAEFLFL